MWQHIDQMRDTLALAEVQTPIADPRRLAEWGRQPPRPLPRGLPAPYRAERFAQRPPGMDRGGQSTIETCGPTRRWRIFTVHCSSSLRDGEPSRRFVLQVKGDSAVAVPRAIALSRAMRNAVGQWK
eukprot:2898169-Pyramimonas_sp.AAC.1